MKEQQSEQRQRYLASLLSGAGSATPLAAGGRAGHRWRSAGDGAGAAHGPAGADDRAAGVGQRAVRQDRFGAGLVAAAWRHTTHRQARAVLALFTAGLAVEAQANARGCLEHAVLLQRLALAVDAGELEPLLLQLTLEQQRRAGQHLNYLDGLDGRSGQQHSDLLQTARAWHVLGRVPADKSRPDVRTAKAHFEGVPHGLDLHSVYGSLSENTHAGLTSAAPYLLPALQHDQPVLARPGPVRWTEALGLLCWSCWAADDAMLRFLVDGQDLARRHVALLARVGLATD